MIKRVLKNKLVSLGYGASFVEQKMKEFTTSIDTSKYTEAELQQRVDVIVYDRPTADIPRFYLNIKKPYVNQFVFDGKIDSFAKLSFVGSQVIVCDFELSSKLCVVGITEDLDIDIMLYNPSIDVCNRFSGATYEEIYGSEREAEASAYLQALTANSRLTSLKAKDILYILLSEYIIDIILISNLNPKIKLYDNAVNFADILTSYKFKYINRRINRIEFVEKDINVIYKASNVKLGNISNDPYLLLNEVNQVPDFDLSRPTFAWIINELGVEELALYTATERYNKNSYRELVSFKDDPELRIEVDRLASRFSAKVGYQISKQYLASVIKKLNKELIVPPVDFIREHTQESFENIEPLKYKFSVASSRKDFEGYLYNAIENNLNGRYKYKFAEKLSGIYLTIGNKLNYTDTNGKQIFKQSIADFNINFNAAIIKRETIIEGSAIPQLIGYIYKDIDNIGTDMLPVPSVEVVFYFPEVAQLGREVEMYNGTAIEVAKGDGISAFAEIGMEEFSQPLASRPKDPNEKYVTVKYLDSDGNILKENIIRDIAIGSVYAPEMIPVINDKEGKEWVLESNQVPNIAVTDNNDLNIVEVRYVKKMSQIRINYINKQGEELSQPVIQNAQVGLTFDKQKVQKFTDKSGVEWDLYQTNPNRLVISENATQNVITLIYDVSKADVFVTYKTRTGVELKPQDKFPAVTGSQFVAETPKELIDGEGLSWIFATDSKSIIEVQESEFNIIELLYDEKKTKVVVSFVDESGTKIKDDIIEFVQVGKKYVPQFDVDFKDFYGKYWKFNKIDKQEFKVSEDEEQNVCSVVYERVLSRIYVSMINKQGQKIKDDIVEEAQVGTKYTPSAIREIEDIQGLVWVCSEQEKTLIVSQSEYENKITYEYIPLIVDISFSYVDDEGNELIPRKTATAQAGSFVRGEMISYLTSQDQRGWEISDNNASSFMVSRHREENIFKINYDKKMVPVTLSFRGIRGDTLKADAQDEAQIGSEYNPIAYDKISSDNGERWMIAKTDPENMFVREGARFTLYYDEIKARVIVKCVNIADNMSIVNDQMIITKLGGVFVPNVQQKVYDKNKMRWNYVGEPAMSIVAKENEQENIITLKYEPDMRDVTIKFLNNFSQTVHPDVVKAEQVGSTVAIKQYEKIIEDNGMGWKLIDISRTSITVDEDDNKNVITQTYAPLIEDVAVRYIDNDGNELTQSLVEKVQVGQVYTAKILPTVTDDEGKIWQYANIPVEPHKMVDGPNKVNIKYEPLLAPITFTYHMTDGQEIIQDKVITIQVGTHYEVKPQERVIDAEGKYWKLVNVSKRSLIVSETPDYNLVQETYEPDFTNVVIVFASSEGKEVAERKQLNLQIGSSFNIQRQEIVEDHDGLSWLASQENPRDAKVSEDPEKNTITIKYDPLLASVFDCFMKEDAEEEIIEPAGTPRQVGSFYSAEVQNEIKDAAGRLWIFSAQANKEPVKDGKFGRIKVYSDETRNKLVIRYAKKVADVTVEYLDNLGNSLRPKETLKLQIGSRFSENIPKKIVDRDGNSWKFNPKSIVDIVVSEVPSENVVNLSYEESKGTVTYKFITVTGESIREDTEELAQIGSHFTPKFDKIITIEDGRVWEFKETDKESLTVDEEDANNIVTLTYMPLKVDVLVNYVDLWQNDVIEPKIEKAQLGSKYRIDIEKEYQDPQGRLYYVKEIKPSEIVIKEKPLGAKKNPNEMTIVFEPVNSDVIIKYRDAKGGIIRGDDKVHIQVGSHYTPEPPEFIKDDKGNEWQLFEATKDEIIISPNPEDNVLIYSYDVAQANVLLRYVSIDGLTVKPEEHVPMQVGQTYVAKPERTVLDKDNKKWSLINIKPTTLIVGSINNIVTITYQEEKARVTLRYVDEKGTVIRAEETTDAQIGSKFVPKITNKVIYNASEIWKIVKTNPEYIIISEDINANTIDLVYSNSGAAAKEEVQETKASVFEEVNPFANTLSEEDKEIIDKMTQAEEAKKAEESQEEAFEFEDPNLKRLAATMKLSLSEKQAIDELNNLNIQIVAELRKSNEAYKSGQTIYDYSDLESLIEKEKSHIDKNLSSLIAQDKSGARLLKVMEAIVASESNDKIFGKLEQRKAVIVTDFFVDKVLDSTDKALYICERGKNTQELVLIDATLGDRKLKDKSDAIRMKTALYYEKLLLDNYFKARSPETDNYFESESARANLGDEVMTIVDNMLVRQFANACGREPFDLEQQSEARAIAKIATPALRTKLQKKIDSLDGRAKRNAQQSMKG